MKKNTESKTSQTRQISIEEAGKVSGGYGLCYNTDVSYYSYNSWAWLGGVKGPGPAPGGTY